MQQLALPISYSEASHLTYCLRGAARRKHQVPTPELYQIHIDRMLRLCYSHPGIEDRHRNKAVLMCVIHDLDQVLALDDRVTHENVQWKAIDTIMHLEDHLRPADPVLAAVLLDVWIEYVADESELSGLIREMANLVRLHQAYMDEKRTNKIHEYEYVAQLRFSIMDEWLQAIANLILTDWIVVKEIQVTGPIIFVFGGPGSGKTHVCSRVASTYNYDHVSLPSLIQEEAENPDSLAGSLIISHRNQGLPIPTTLSVGLLKEKIRTTPAGRGVLVDGFPENVAQVQEYELEVTSRYSTIFLNCPVQTMVQRATDRWEDEHHPEDSPAAIQTRVTNFMTTMTPILAHLTRNPIERIFSGGNEQMMIASVERIVV